MIVAEPTAEEREEIKRAQAHRFPELRYFPRPGDDGKPVKLPVVFGNPSGACQMPAGKKPSKVWGQKVAQTFGGEKAEWRPLVADCLLWPPPHIWAEWLQRWPALEDSIKPSLVAKYGGDTDQVTEPSDDAQPPPVVAEAKAAHPGALWLRFEPKGAVVDLVVKSPSSTQWMMFSQAMKQAGADSWQLVRELAEAVVVASTMPLAQAIARWPGLALQIDMHASYLAGMVAEFEEGEL